MPTILPHMVWRGLSANLECMSEMCCMRLAANTRRKNDAKNCRLRTIPQLYLVIYIIKSYAKYTVNDKKRKKDKNKNNKKNSTQFTYWLSSLQYN